MKKILIMAFGLFLFIPVTSVFAYDFTDGYFDKNPPTISDNRVIDNNLGTKIIIFNGNSPFIITLKESIDIKAFYLVGLRKESTVKFYDASGKVIATIGGSQFLSGYNDLVLRGVKKIDFNNTYGDANLFEFELFQKESIVYSPVTTLTESHNHSSITLNWTNPVGSDFSESIIKNNGVEIARIGSTAKSYTINNLKPETTYKFDVVASYSDGGYSDGTAIEVKTDISPVVKNLKATTTYNSADITWQHPPVTDSTGIRILKEGVEVADITKLSTTYKVTGLKPETTYKYEVVVLYKDFESIPVPIEFKTLESPKDAGEVAELTATATHDRVDLKWKLPDSEAFKHVNIYREKKTSWFSSIGFERVYASGTRIFETNGTYFNDLTVSADTKYEYTLTTQSLESVESEGVKVQVTTGKLPDKPEIGGGGWEKEPNGDFLFKWTSPTTGKVKVVVGGKVYATVSASDLQIKIPGADMKYTVLGAPDVTLTPVDEKGEEGTPSKPPASGGGGSGGGVELPFGASDFIKGAFDLFKLFGPYILLALSLFLLPRLITIIKDILKKNKERNKEVIR